MAKILAFEKGSVAEYAGLKIGDEITAVNGRAFTDIIDYLYADSLEQAVFKLKRKGREKTVTVLKDAATPLGVDFGAQLEITPKRCKNKCLFCFIDQLPKGMRPTMYVKDDDYRMSVICGNYVTMTNLTEDDYDRIISYHLSPLYVSVHAADNDVRCQLVTNPKTRTLMDSLKRLTDNGIIIHTQVVLCEGLNDGAVLQDTLEKLYDMKNVASLAVVPVGLTGCRDNLFPLKPLSDKCLNDTIDRVENFNVGKNWCWCSDEFYVKSGREIPSYESYGSFPQIENGVGLVADFLNKFEASLSTVPEKSLDGKGRKIMMITGESFVAILQKTVKKLEKYTKNVQIDVCAVKNTFFGGAITVSGLVTGGDIVKQVPKGYDKYVVPHNMLKEFSDLFLDGLSKTDVLNTLGGKTLQVACGNGEDFISIVED